MKRKQNISAAGGAARASVIVMTPFLGSLALMANEVYMITRLSDLYGVELETGAIAGLIGSLGASFCGTDPLYPSFHSHRFRYPWLLLSPMV